MLDRTALEAAQVGPVCCDTAHALAGAFTTGRIPRQSFERVLESTLVEREGSTGADHFTEAERLVRLVPDQHPDEHATCYVVQVRGLAASAACGHLGLFTTT